MSNPDPSKLSKHALLEAIFENTETLLGRPKGFSFTTGKLGNCQLSVIGTDAQNNQLVGAFNLQVVNSAAIAFNPKFGTPVTKPPPAPASGAPTSK